MFPFIPIPRLRSLILGLVATLALLAAPRLPAAPSDLSDADQKALAGYHLTLEKLDRFDAANQKIIAALPQDPALARELGGEGVLNVGKSLDDALGQFDARAPRLATVLQSAGTTDRDYVLTLMSLMFASSGATMKQYTPAKPLPAYIPADNVAFADQNPALFKASLDSLKVLSKARQHDED